MSANQKQNKKDTKNGKQDETRPIQKQLTLEANVGRANANGGNWKDSELLAELKKLRQENGNAFRETKQSLNRLETSVGEIKQQMEKLDERLTTVEHRVSTA